MKINEESTAVSKRVLVLVVLFWFAHYVFVPFFSPYLEGLGIASSTIGIIVGTYGFSQLLLRIPFGIVADKIKNHRVFMLLGFAALMLAGFFLYTANNVFLFLLGRFLSGVSASTWVSFTVLYSGLFSGKNSSKAVSQIMTANNLGTLLAYVFGMLLHDRVGIHILFLISIGSGFVGLILMLTVEEKGSFSQQPLTFSDVTVVLQDRTLLLQSALAALVQLITFATAMSFTSNYASELGATGAQLGLLSIVFSAAGMLGSFWVGTGYGRRLSYRVQFALAFGLMALHCFLVPFCTSMVALLLVQAVGGIGRAIAMTLTMSLSSQTIPQHLRSTSMGVYQSVYGLGMTIGPIAMGTLLELSNGSYLLAFGVVALISLAGLVWSTLAIKTYQE